MQYLIILLDDTSTSYCHYSNRGSEHRLIPIDVLREGIKYAMLDNLMVQFVWPGYDMPQEYVEVIESIDHNNIAPAMFLPKGQKTDIAVFDDWRDMCDYAFDNGTAYVLRIDSENLFLNTEAISANLVKVQRLSVILTDVDKFDDYALAQYKSVLDVFGNEILGIYKKGGPGVNGVYNQDFSPNTILIEIGGNENTTNEVLNTTLAFSKVFMEVINE